MTQGSVHSALSRIEDSYCVGDVIIASTAVLGSGVVLRADSGCSITIRDGVCLGSGVVIHATSGSLELHQGVCVAGGVIVVGEGSIGSNTCVGAGATILNPSFPSGSVVSAESLWGDDSRQCLTVDEEVANDSTSIEEETLESAPADATPTSTPDPWESDSSSETIHSSDSEPDKSEPASESAIQAPVEISKQVIGIQQFEMMVHKMFPERKAFRDSQKER